MRIAFSVFSIFLFLQIGAQDRVTGHNFATRSNAIDAAIAANAALGLMEPTGCGIGGDIFVILWDAKTKKLYGLNGSGRSPKSLTLEYFKENEMTKIPAYGPLPVSVPGCVDGWFEMHERFGKLPMKKILSPAIEYAEAGFPITELIGYYLELSSRRFKNYPNFQETYMPNGEPLKKGTLFKNPQLAKTYKTLAKKGRDAFYKGSIAQTISKFMEEQGGFLSMEDLQEHKSEWIDPVSTNYKGYDVWELPPNGQGIAALQILNLLEPYAIQGMSYDDPKYIHLFVEAKKLAFEDRAKYYADPEFNKIPTEQLISKAYADQQRELINPKRANRKIEFEMPDTDNTIYLTTADKEGNMVSLIQSNYRGMGSGMVPPGLGFMLQDRGELFSLEPDHFNVYAPGKRPFHTIIPAFVTKDGVPFMSYGVMGGAMQPQGHAQIIINMIDFGMNLQEAGDAPRIRHAGSSQPTGQRMTDGGVITLESGFSPETLRALAKKGHKIQTAVGPYGGYQAILYDAVNKIYYGASESRKDGHAAGY